MSRSRGYLALGMWYVVRYEDVRTALFDATRLTTESPQSTIFDTFGAHILTTEGATHDRYREASRHPFAPGFDAKGRVKIEKHLCSPSGRGARRWNRGDARVDTRGARNASGSAQQLPVDRRIHRQLSARRLEHVDSRCV
jgi:hypothetical protein